MAETVEKHDAHRWGCDFLRDVAGDRAHEFLIAHPTPHGGTIPT
ncbi:hypothetical protein [Brevibacterium linens]|nr:hypothetical protein [Brevibacterium linens]